MDLVRRRLPYPLYAAVTVMIPCALMMIVTCRPAHPVSSTYEAGGEPDETSYNSDRSLALIVTRPDMADVSLQPTQFYVMRVRDSVVLNRGSFLRGYVKWINDSTLEKLSVPGKLREDADLDRYRSTIVIPAQPLLK